ncbi:MAG: aromatic ring-hydroxylating dioxygenase subunit alpha [Pseudomonadota bacterium]
MNEPRITVPDVEYNALKQAEPGLPMRWYHDPEQYQLELAQIWQKSWLYVCRASDLAEALAYRTFEIGNQNIVILRDADGILRAFHNACRHRGSILCTEDAGKLKTKLLTCPYHQWSYSCDDGRLVRISSFAEPDGFSKADYGLFPVALHEWRGCIFIHLDNDAQFDERQVFGRPTSLLANWPLEQMVEGDSWTHVIDCNWKTWWENFGECLHCPGVHPELVELVPLYGRRIISPMDLPDWTEHEHDDDPKYKGGLREGGETWSTDGSAQGHVIPSLTGEDLARGQTYCTALPSVFMVGYADHFRIVRVRPMGPEKTELSVGWYFLPETLNAVDYDKTNVTDFARLVIGQDADACALNQKGLHAAPLERGVLMPEEWVLKLFHDWVRKHLD